MESNLLLLTGLTVAVISLTVRAMSIKDTSDKQFFSVSHMSHRATIYVATSVSFENKNLTSI